MNTNQITEILSQNKAEQIQVFHTKEYICETVIIATSLNSVHAFSLSEKIVLFVKDFGQNCIIDGDSKDGWIAIEIPFISTILHIMIQEKREYYNIEEILQKKWKVVN